MAHHLVSILGSALLTRPLGNSMPTDFPSPEVREPPHLSSLPDWRICFGEMRLNASFQLLLQSPRITLLLLFVSPEVLPDELKRQRCLRVTPLV